jgi:hypothetical protein
MGGSKNCLIFLGSLAENAGEVALLKSHGYEVSEAPKIELQDLCFAYGLAVVNVSCDSKDNISARKVLTRIKKSSPHTRIVILSCPEHNGMIERLRNDYSGLSIQVLVKPFPPGTLLNLVKLISQRAAKQLVH